MLNLLITGSNGQLGHEFREASALYPFYNFIFTDIGELDITNAGDVERFFRDQNVDVVINCAAYTAVDRAELEPEAAMLINRDAVENLVNACKNHNTFPVHISTDYVFDGMGSKPYREDDLTNPRTSYGRSKLAGEEAMMKCLEKGMIIRTSWLYSSFGANFVKTIIKKGAETGELNVVSDQFGCPTYARDLAVTILDILPKALSSLGLEIFHYSNEGQCSWFDFALAAVEMAGISCRVYPVTSGEYPQKAPRPRYSVLDKTKIKEQYGISVPEWKESLRECLEVLAEGNK